MRKKGKKNDLPRELERAGALCLAFANTGVSRRDDRRLDSKAPPEIPVLGYTELLVWAQRMSILAAQDGERLRLIAGGRLEEAAATGAQAAHLRAALIRVFTGLALKKEPRSEDLGTLNGWLRVRSVVPGDDGFRLAWLGDDDALDRPLWTIAQSAVELLASEDRRRVRQCATAGCRRLFVYANSRRMWCDDALCGNRARGRRRYEKIRRPRLR